MSKNNNVIKLNGKRYDATSGLALDAPTEPTTKATAEHTHNVHVVVKPAADRHIAQHVAGHAPQHAKTLRRAGLHQPSKPVVHAQSPVDAPADGLILAPVALVKPGEQRLSRAQHTPKSKFISRFGATVHDASAPSATPIIPDTPAVASAVLSPSVPQVKQPQTTAELLQRALEQATSHEQPLHPKAHHRRKKHVLSATVGVSLVVAFLGFFVVENLNSLRLQAASSKAGFSAAMPSYHPAGFRLGQLNYDSGVVALNYVSNSDQDRTYSVIEKPSSWDNQALLQHVVIPNGQPYQTLQSNGRTYYTYGAQTITWVSGGLWYTVHSQGALGNQQLLALANSL